MESKKGNVVIGTVGVEQKPDGSKDFSRALNFIETDEDRADKRRKLAEKLKIPESAKPGTPDMVYFQLRNAQLQAKDVKARKNFEEMIRLFSKVKEDLTKSLLKQSISGETGSMTRDQIREKINNLSIDEVYTLLQQEIDSYQRDLDSSPSSKSSQTFFTQRIKLAEDLQQRLLSEGLNKQK